MPITEHLNDDVLNEYLDRALDAAAMDMAATHLAACAACTGRLATLRAVFAELAELPPAPLKRDLTAGVLAAVRRPRAAELRPLADPQRRPAQLVFSLQLLAALALLAFAWPFVAPLAHLDRLAAPNVFGGIVPNLANIGLSLSSLWSSGQHWLAGLAAQPEPPLLGLLSPLVVGLLLVFAGGLWLLGNALLLRPRLAPRPRRLV